VHGRLSAAELPVEVDPGVVEGQWRSCTRDGIFEPARRPRRDLTVTRLGVTGSQLKTVMGTNPVESMIEVVRNHARNVKRW
jgi:hypothetical protein